MKDVAIENRKCRYVDENYLDVYEYYSYSACLVQCRKDAHFKTCNCTHHLMPNTGMNKNKNCVRLTLIVCYFANIISANFCRTIRTMCIIKFVGIKYPSEYKSF